MLSERFDEFKHPEKTKKWTLLKIGRCIRVDFREISISHKKALKEEEAKARDILQEIKFLNDPYADDHIWEGSRDRSENLLETGRFYRRTKMIRGHIGTWKFWIT